MSHHATILVDGGKVQIEVIDMVKGDVFVNERRINTQKQTLYHGDVLSFGKCDEKFKLVNTRDENLSDSINER